MADHGLRIYARMDQGHGIDYCRPALWKNVQKQITGCGFNAWRSSVSGAGATMRKVWELVQGLRPCGANLRWSEASDECGTNMLSNSKAHQHAFSDGDTGEAGVVFVASNGSCPLRSYNMTDERASERAGGRRWLWAAIVA
jgi:hypothetical protein